MRKFIFIFGILNFLLPVVAADKTIDVVPDWKSSEWLDYEGAVEHEASCRAAMRSKESTQQQQCKRQPDPARRICTLKKNLIARVKGCSG